MASEPKRNSIPFEPRQRSKKNKKSQPASDGQPSTSKPSQKDNSTNSPPKEETASSQPTHTNRKADRAIPQVVSRRMIRRMGVFSGVPMVVGMLVLISSYFITTQVVELPHSAVILVSMAFLGMSVVGLSYGVISASWDEQMAGSLLGWQEFTTNFRRLRQAWRSHSQNSTQND
ncbi:PAM68 family protein [Geitlerinema sp. PCC 9228]|uniref:PAM68 family protein n=1 Tax=Geitlerinema sp. PCC 9228 TaxID=111611 RepID=UPI0008F9CB4F|nr:PAM68 family protein [Geitlerinema sp. PCC 9228]